MQAKLNEVDSCKSEICQHSPHRWQTGWMATLAILIAVLLVLVSPAATKPVSGKIWNLFKRSAMSARLYYYTLVAGCFGVRIGALIAVICVP